MGHSITELPAWERLFKKIVWKQLGDPEGKKILDFGSGEGITANYYAEKNDVTAIEPSEEMLFNAWNDRGMSSGQEERIQSENQDLSKETPDHDETKVFYTYIVSDSDCPCPVMGSLLEMGSKIAE